MQAVFFAKYMYWKNRSQLKVELNQCKYLPAQSNIAMMNKFITIADKLDWPVAVQIDRFIKILPMNLCQFVISHPNPDFEAVRESIGVYRDVIEVDSISHSFKNVSFVDETCNLCGKDHQSLCCPSLKSVIEMETSIKETYRPRKKKKKNKQITYNKQLHKFLIYKVKETSIKTTCGRWHGSHL